MQKNKKPESRIKYAESWEGTKNCPAKKEGTIKKRFFAQSLGLRSFI